MKILKALMLSLMLSVSFNTFADGTDDARAARTNASIGEDANGCGPSSTCSECVNQGTLANDTVVGTTEDAAPAAATPE